MREKLLALIEEYTQLSFKYEGTMAGDFYGGFAFTLKKIAAGDNCHVEQISPDEHLSVNVTAEGVIIDTFQGDEVIGTMGMTFDEWFDFVKGRDK